MTAPATPLELAHGVIDELATPSDCDECCGEGADLEDSSKACWKCGGSGDAPKPDERTAILARAVIEAAEREATARTLLERWVDRGFPMGCSHVWDATRRFLGLERTDV